MDTSCRHFQLLLNLKSHWTPTGRIFSQGNFIIGTARTNVAPAGEVLAVVEGLEAFVRFPFLRESLARPCEANRQDQQAECGGPGADLSEAGRDTAGDRAGGGARQGAPG